jgi:hypothetical protein
MDIKPNSKTTQTKSRAHTIADNWKKREIKYVLELRDEMIANDIDKKLIDEYVEEEYEKINEQYTAKINKSSKKVIDNKLKKEIKMKRDKAVNFLLKNKSWMETNNVDSKYIKKYVDEQYEYIDSFYKVENFVMNIDFIDD